MTLGMIRIKLLRKFKRIKNSYKIGDAEEKRMIFLKVKGKWKKCHGI